MEAQVMFGDTELQAVLRKKALYRVLARHEAQRLGLEISKAELQATTDVFRHYFHLTRADEMRAWMEQTGTSLQELTEMMRDIALINRLDALYAAEIDAGMADQHRMLAARERLQGPKG